MSEFSDRPFVAGSLIGMRAFAVDSLGRLRGPSYSQVFTPGENEARCEERPRLPIGYLPYFDPLRGTYVARGRSVGAGGHWIKAPKPGQSRLDRVFGAESLQPCDGPPTCAACVENLAEKQRKKEERRASHQVGAADCTCGFYAYFDGGNDYKEPSRVTALIEGYGVCTVGTRGFRASKAKVVALVRPGKKFKPHIWSQVERLYPDAQIYARKRDALAAHPLTVPDLLAPESCEDFWTREAS